MRTLGAFLAVLWCLVATPSAQTTGLAGRVVDAADARHPIRRAVVTLTGPSVPAGRSAITDEQGRFAFSSIPAGEFTLSATRPGFLKATYGATRPGRPGTPISLTAGTPAPEVTLTMSHGSALGGVLRDIAGDPAPGMRVEAIRILRGATGDRGESGGVALTDDRGEYRIYGLPAGDYVIVATATAIIMGIGEIGAPSEAQVDAILASLPRRSIGPVPAPPPAATPPPESRQVIQGKSTPPVYYPGVVASGEAARISIGVGEQREGLDFSLKLSHAAAINGVVMPMRGQALPQFQLMIHPAGPQLPVYGGSAGGPSLSRTPDGGFRFANAAPGRYRIIARTQGLPGTPTTIMSSGGSLPTSDLPAVVQWAMADVEVSGDDVSGVTLRLQPALRVAGRLAFDARTPRAPDAPAARISLEPVPDSEFGSNGLTTSFAATLRRDGTFEFPAVLPGSYRLTGSLAGWSLRSAMLDGRDVLDGGLTVGATDAGGLVLTFSDRRTAIAGTLTAASGRPAAEYFVVAFSAERELWRAPSRRVLSTRPSTTGAFELTDLPPGTYYLAVLTDVEPADVLDPAFLDSVVPAALRVTVAEGERKIQDMRIGG